MTDLRQRVEDLSPEKRLLLESLRRERKGRRSPRPAASGAAGLAESLKIEPFGLLSEEDRARIPAGVEDAFPLTLVQLGMLHHMELTADEPTPTYHNVNSFHIRTPFNAERFQEAADAVIRRHPQLRTSFDLTGFSEPLQLVHAQAELRVTVEDLRHLGEAEQKRLLARFIDEENRNLLDLGRPPLVRLQVHRWTDDRFSLTLTEPHAISDGWSTAANLEEIFQIYLARMRGEAVLEAPPPAAKFRDFVALERLALASEGQRDFWARQLNANELIRLYRSPRKPAAEGPVDRKPSIWFPPEVVAGLQRLAKAAGVPLKSVLLAAHLKVMSLYGGGEDVVTGLTTHGRPEVLDGEQVRGLFLNTVPFFFSLSAGSWSDCARQVFQQEAEIWPHRRYPLAAMQQLCGRRMLFETAFSFLHFHSLARILSSGEGERIDEGSSDLSVTDFPLMSTFTLRSVSNALRLTMEHDPREFGFEQVLEIGACYERVLAAMAADPLAPHDASPLLPREQEQQLFEEWNKADVSFQREPCLHRLFEAQAARRPDAVAVVWGDQSLTYEELNGRANRLAHRLRGFGAGPGNLLVGLYVERSPDVIVGLLGILKAGGAYVPMDPAYPRERLAHMLADSRLRLLLTQESLRANVPESDGVHILCLDRDEGRNALSSRGNPAADPGAEGVAYVIYTSGSTGRPKGVVIPHGNTVRLFRSTGDWFRFSEEDVWTLFHSHAFDFSVWEIWGALLYGGRLVVVPYEVSRSPEDFHDLLVREGVTVLNQTPSAFQQQAAVERPDWLSALRIVIFGGEAVNLPALAPWIERYGEERPRLVNMYGITETTVHVTYRPLTAADVAAPAGAGTPIGRAMPDLQLYVLDRSLAPLPVGVGGEIYVGGDGLARGYLGRPELTAERFLPDPFRRQAGARLYKTGDLGRYLPGGDVEYLGRSDRQVKIRGFRIELEEIEAALASHSAVRQAAVILREDVPGDKRLVGYALWEGEAVPLSDLRFFLQKRLPEYMVPAALVAVAAFPLTANGKIDLRALPAPGSPAPLEADRGSALHGMVEELVAEIWASVLRVDRVGPEDNFFDLGGHSLLATLVISRIRAALAVELPLRRLFEAATVRGLARAVEEARQDREGARLPALIPIPREELGEGIPLSFSQERMWFLQQLDPASTVYNLPYAARLRGALDPEALAWCFTKLVERHETLRTVFRKTDDGPVQVILPAAPFALGRIDLGALPADVHEAELKRLAGEDGSRMFDLARGPLLRATLVTLREGEHALLFVIHHIVSDGWSWQVIGRDLTRMYHACAERQAPDLPPLPIQYADFAVWQRRALSGELLEAELAWWRTRLGGSLPVLRLPTDRRRSAVPGFQPASVSGLLPPALTRDLKALSRGASASLYMTLLAGWTALLARITGEADVLLGAPIANRNRIETEGLIGFFLNTLLLRTDLAGNLPFQDLVSRVRQTALGAFAHQDLPLEKVLQSIGWARDANRSMPFSVMFLMQNVPRQAVALRGLDFVFFTGGRRGDDLETAIFDVGLTVTERDDEGLDASFTYNGHLFDEVTMIRLLDRYRRLLAAAVASPGRRLWDLDLISDEEAAEILAAGRASEGGGPFAPVHRSIAELALRMPEVPAVVQGEAVLSSDELERRANRLARHLRGRGIGQESVVGVALDRSPELVVALLAVLKAGGAYVPLDPGYPAERLAFILDDARAAVLVSTHGVLERLPALAGRVPEIVDLEADAEEIARHGGEQFETPVEPESLAYLIYTSGSTGKPKGVMVPHGALANYVVAFQEEHAIGPQDRVLQINSISFDTSAEEIYPCLIGGAALMLRSDAMLGSSDDFLRLCGELGITILDLPTAFWHGLVARLAEESPVPLPDSLRLVVIGGERALPERVAAWRELAPPRVRLLNTYGPTEATIVATRVDLTVDAPFDPAAEVPIGRPVRKASVRVVDQALRLAPPRIAGELWVGGAGVARGYAGRPDLTAERFLPDPWSGQPGARAYATGDLVRLLSAQTGDLEFVGRVDQQVKIRGFRVELSEIEAALARHPAVAEAAVAAREDQPGDRRLVAYVVAGPGREAPAQELRPYLKNLLPDFMVPAVFVTLKALPLTPGGKVDRRALPAPDGMERQAGDHVAPRNPAEETIAAIWREVLGVEQVGAHDDFFALGGHSLLLPQLLHRLRSAFRIEIPLRLLFDESSLEGMAFTVEALLIEEIEKEIQMDAGDCAPPAGSLVEITPASPGARPPFFCVHAVGGDVLSFFTLARSLGADQPFYAFQAQGLEDEQEPLASIELMAEKYLAELLRVQPAGPYLLGGWSLGGLVAFEMAQQLRARGKERVFLTVIDTGPGIPKGMQTDPATEDEADPSHQLLVLVQYFKGAQGVDLGLTLTDFADHPADEQIRLFLERSRRAGILHSADSFGQVQRLLRVYRAGVRAYRAYRPRPYAGPITVIRAALTDSPPDLGWSAVIGLPIDPREVPGNHFTMFAEPNVDVLAMTLRACLPEVER